MRDYDKKILTQEIAKADYDGMAVDGAWSYLFEPWTETIKVPAPPLAPSIASIVAKGGPDKAEGIAVAILAKYPSLGPQLLRGEIPLTPGQAVDIFGDDLAAEEVDKIISHHPRAMDIFTAANWPGVDDAGNQGGQKAISGFPNSVSLEDFKAAWVEAGRK